MAFKIFLSPPNMCGKEREYVNEAFDTNWIAPYGPHLNAFEREMASYIGVDSALAVTSGTAAIHLALRLYGVGPGDLVFCSDFTFAGSCNPILYQGAEPVFIDSEPYTWNMSSVALEKAFRWAKSQGKLPKAVIVVDLYGESANWDKILPVCREYNVPVIEDAAEAVGSTYKGKKCGSFGDINVLSFNGNKILTTSGGGMVLSHDNEAIAKMRFWSTQAREPVIWYEHKEFGYNYRLSNVCAGIGRGQLECLDKKLKRRREIHDRYTEQLKGLPLRVKQEHRPGANYWLSVFVSEDEQVTPNKIISRLQNAQIESRPAWKPMHMQPIYRTNPFVTVEGNGRGRANAYIKGSGIDVGADIFRRGLCLPSDNKMTEEQQDRIIEIIHRCFL